jgi:hypothetical protein
VSEKTNAIHVETDLLAHTNGWNGEPQVPPDYTIKVWRFEEYWYVAASDGVHRVMSDDQVKTDEDVIWSVGEQIRILLLPQYRKP